MVTAQVNFFGYVRVTQALMPLVRAGCAATGRRGRMIYTGTGGGVLTPVPPLLTAYMASKFAVEAFVRSFRVEMQLTHKPVDACIISPGFVKPTMLVENGLKLNERMWAACEERLGTTQARDEYSRRAELPKTGRGAAAARTWMVRDERVSLAGTAPSSITSSSIRWPRRARTCRK